MPMPIHFARFNNAVSPEPPRQVSALTTEVSEQTKKTHELIAETWLMVSKLITKLHELHGEMDMRYRQMKLQNTAHYESTQRELVLLRNYIDCYLQNISRHTEVACNDPQPSMHRAKSEEVDQITPDRPVQKQIITQGVQIQLNKK